ncbi:hypothetical protein HIM_09308 [Hirsutella minnesotensis 3608]|uniref:Methyltransferase domain-containing protein n=1 Tax=Hirsutella minnesotensis 3608 TaxID=1043627 RepID=A0A0F7ZSG0_9HYPO|nr:hypothetical protein HIM_09308 [Hirsutella minnesotensis 3608]
MTDTVSANRAFFNEHAAQYDKKFESARRVIERQVKDNIDFIGAAKGGRLLDYACGTGFLSTAMSDHLGQCIGIDVSESMVEAYNAKARSAGFSAEERIAYTGDLLDPSVPSPADFSDARFQDFDMAGVGAGFHHFDDCTLAATRLAERLRPGGVLFVLDFVATGPHSDTTAAEAEKRGVRHHGFNEDMMRRIFEGAGAGRNFGFLEMDQDVVFDGFGKEGKNMVRRVFLARGEKV